ncbi:hypothetical protein [Actinomadura sp. KC216]|uniref:hypothetical protein n=1 Tax=Actinomadura sp. KC216 TaxID=2530370 RepID=UPI0014048E39|nr:hypothetical protein [Actinomadura sp. KC216]
MSDYRWNGAYMPGARKVNGNKGIMRALKKLKRQQAETRNAQTPAERRRKNRVA